MDDQDCVSCGSSDAYIHSSLEYYICSSCDDDYYDNDDDDSEMERGG